MYEFSKALDIRPGITAIIGSGGKTSLLYRLGRELAPRGRVILTTTTHIFQPDWLPVARRSGSAPLLCVGTPAPGGKLTAPEESIEDLAAIADYVLVEADGAARRPLKAHAAHEPVIPVGANQVICVVGASGLWRPAVEVVHRPELFIQRSGSKMATPEAVARVLLEEGLYTRVLINQTDVQEAGARALGAALSGPVLLASVQEGEILC